MEDNRGTRRTSVEADVQRDRAGDEPAGTTRAGQRAAKKASAKKSSAKTAKKSARKRPTSKRTAAQSGDTTDEPSGASNHTNDGRYIEAPEDVTNTRHQGDGFRSHER